MGYYDMQRTVGNSWKTYCEGVTTDIKHRLGNILDLREGDRVGLLLSLHDGTISMVREGKVVGHKIITGVTGPVVPCICINSIDKAVRLHGELEVGMLAYASPEPPVRDQVTVDPNDPHVMMDNVTTM